MLSCRKAVLSLSVLQPYHLRPFAFATVSPSSLRFFTSFSIVLSQGQGKHSSKRNQSTPKAGGAGIRKGMDNQVGRWHGDENDTGANGNKSDEYESARAARRREKREEGAVRLVCSAPHPCSTPIKVMMQDCDVKVRRSECTWGWVALAVSAMC